jgi:hypothetical protein
VLLAAQKVQLVDDGDGDDVAVVESSDNVATNMGAPLKPVLQ